MKTVIMTQALKTALCVITTVFMIAADTALAQNTAEILKNTAVGNENVEVLIQGGPLPNLNGLDFGPDGNLWGASVIAPAIVAINPETGQIVKRLTWNDGVKSPDDLHWGPDGSLFWVNIIHGEVVRRYPNGTTKILAKLPPGPDGITLSDDGRRLFVGDCFMANKLYEIDPDGNKAPRVITDKLGQLAAFNAMDWGPDGKLYGPRWFEGAVARLDPDSGEFEDIESGLGVAAAVKFDRKGQLYALSAIGRVWRLNPSDGTKELIASLPAALDNFAFSADNRLFVSNGDDGSVIEVVSGGPHRMVLRGGLGLAGGITIARVGGKETLMVPDAVNLRSFDPATGIQVGVARDIESIATAIGPVTSAAPHGENLLVASLKGFVKLWSLREARTLALFKHFKEPSAIVSLGDDFAIAELGSGSVVRVTPDLGYDMPVPDSPYYKTTLATGLKMPSGLAYAEGNLYVSEHGAGRVLQILENGRQIKPRVVKDGLKQPDGIALADGALYVLERGTGRLLRLNPKDGSSAVVAEGLQLGMPVNPENIRTLAFKGVTISNGQAWVSGDKGDEGTVIYRIKLKSATR